MASPHGASRSHSMDTPHREAALWTSDQPDGEICTWPHNTYKRQISIPPAAFEPTIPASQRLPIHALDRAATDSGSYTAPAAIKTQFLYEYLQADAVKHVS
jgi:hypothetical protein